MTLVYSALSLIVLVGLGVALLVLFPSLLSRLQSPPAVKPEPRPAVKKPTLVRGGESKPRASRPSMINKKGE